MIRAVVFDIGNVLIAWHPERFYDRAIGEDRRRALFAAVDLHKMHDAVDRGGDLATVVQDCARSHPEWAAEILLWRDNWLDLVGPVIDGSVAVLRALKATGVPVFALSNFGRGTFQMALPLYPVLAEFDRTYLSGDMGVNKPEAEIYRRVEEDCGLAPEALLFTDDRAENIDAATARGWQTHLFCGPEGFRTRLQQEGLLP
ncbi:MAG: HAD family hydrolase [Marivita sp.]|uniref:HAD family hydrolase n=1 Tax=Marivita sp. TaxID=2003365 RepID=UPI003EF58639